MDAETREAVCGAAVRAAQAVNYEGAGTIEFIADASDGLKPDRIWFMEMNTRLQVEHPVTEEITGQDLVEWQLRVASGEKLPLRQDELSISGHAIEARLYAEDPAKGFLPSVGKLELFELGDEGRVETGVEEGDSISPFYDPMIAKLIATGDDRNSARVRLRELIFRTEIWPVKSNAFFLGRALEHPDFVTGRVDTGLIARDLEKLIAAPKPSPKALTFAASDLVPYDLLQGFRLNSERRETATFALNGSAVQVKLDCMGSDEPRDDLVFGENGQSWELSTSFRMRGSTGLHDGEIEAPMPGKVTAVEVKKGDKVTKGQRLLTLEAMKMEHGLTAPFDGTVAELAAKPGVQVSEGQLLVKVEPDA
jgi:3-methylcrotonyl-CoA carboxylase alpha subunit